MMKDKITHILWVRITAFMLFISLAIVIVGCAAGLFLALEERWYDNNITFYESTLCETLAYKDANYVIYCTNSEDMLTEYLKTEENRNFLFRIKNEYGTVIASDYIDDSAYEVFSNYGWQYYDNAGRELYYGLDVYVRSPLTVRDNYYTMSRYFGTLYNARYSMIAVIIIAIILELVVFIFLLCSAGHKRGVEGNLLIRQDRIPFDLYLTGLITIISLWWAAFDEAVYQTAYSLSNSNSVMNYWLIMMMSAVTVGVYAALTAGFFMTLAARLKVGKWWRNTIIYIFFRMIFRFIRKAVRALPVIWKTMLGYLVFMFLNLLLGAYFISYNSGFAFLVVLFMDLMMFVILCIISIQMKTLAEGGEALANGELDHKINTLNLYYDFKKHGEALNRVNEGLSRAVDARLRSERFKTELITNVSHDIKTPLTSIINYVDLLKKENLESENAGEYIEVIERQSLKLKKMTEDIIEASKASAGVITVNTEHTDAVELLNQSLGEYEERLQKSGITVVINAPPGGAYIKADGRLLWRVFDNMLGNICKYALGGTRAYFDIMSNNRVVMISIKNISANELNISADELMERFIRGDSSRGSEGSGLGLSISKSLTELQGGTFDIYLDGDLFKVILTFPECMETYNIELKSVD